MNLHNTDGTIPMEPHSDTKTGDRKAENERKKAVYASWLDRIPSIGAVTAGRLLAEYGNAEQLYRMPEKEVAKLVERRLLTAVQAEKLREWKKDYRYEPNRLYEDMTAQGIRAIFYEDKEFPERLRNIPDPPKLLYVKGDVPDESKPGVSIVGARLCSDYGRYTARRYAHAFAEAGVQVISGMALGIDGISHQAAMEAGGRTFAVLGCGADVCYPAQNRDIYERIPGQGGVLSEYPPGTAPCAGLFPRRNRIISGLADLLLVIEARRKSGTLITVDAALEQGKEVYALPGRVTDALSGGCNELIAQGAGIATSPEQMLKALFDALGHGIILKKNDAQAGQQEQTCRQNGGGAVEGRTGEKEIRQQDAVYALLSEEGQTYDMLMSRSTLVPGELSAALIQLCVSGAAVCRQGRYYRGGAE